MKSLSYLRYYDIYCKRRYLGVYRWLLDDETASLFL